MLDKTFDPGRIEEKITKTWESEDYFSCDPESDADPYCIMMPPPNVTGSLHIGHAMQYTLQDILVRHHRKLGKDVLWQPGTDHASIATHMVVEKQLAQEGKTRFDLGREKFLERTMEWKDYSAGTMVSQMKRLGASADWDRERFTMDEGLSNAVRKVFVKLYNDDLIYQDQRLINWDPVLQTAVADIEVLPTEKQGKIWHFEYPLADDPDQVITVATTRPETVFGDTAVAVHPDDERYAKLIGKHVILPIMDRKIPIVADEHADPEKGSGAVKITPAHDFDDFEVGQRHDLDMISILDRYAKMNDNAPDDYVGLDRFEAREKVVEQMNELGRLAAVKDHEYKVPIGERSDAVLEPRLTDQWFCDAETLAKPAYEAVNGDHPATKIIPDQWRKVYNDWLENIEPWCISRQLWWGHQIPVWYGPDGRPFVYESDDDAFKAAEEYYGEKTDLTQDPDILDTWFSSALWPFSTLGWPDQTTELDKYYPTSVMVTGFDIIFFWVARMMMMGLYFMDDVPFERVYFTPLVRDEDGVKMSKSRGNVIDPLDAIDEYGADAMRFALAIQAGHSRNVNMSMKRIESYRNFATKLWNASRFCEMNDIQPLYDLDFSDDKLVPQLSVNRWILDQLAKARTAVNDSLDSYQFNMSCEAMYHFIWGDFCDWYLELIKPILNGPEDQNKAETVMTAGAVLGQILDMLNPFMPFITEELHDRLSVSDQPLITKGYEDMPVRDEAACADINWIMEMVTSIRQLRSEMNIDPSDKVAVMVKPQDDDARHRVNTYRLSIKQMANLGELTLIDEISAEMASGAVQDVVQGSTLILPLADVIDFEVEKERLIKQMADLDDDLQMIERKLANDDFVTQAPETIVEKERRKKQEALEAKSKIKQALSTLKQAFGKA